MILVNNTNDVYQLAEFDLGSSDVNFHKVTKHPFEKSSGSYSMLNDVFLSLYKLNDIIYLRVGDNDCIFEKLKIEYFNKRSKSKFVIWNDEEKILSLDYKISLGLKDKFFSFLSFDHVLDTEELDFGLYIYNISRNKERQKIMLDPNYES